jgi:hypothetical protein
MNEAAVGRVGEPHVVALFATASVAYEFAWKRAEEGFVARVLRGQKMTTLKELFDELGAALQFPRYFGENWNAAEECLKDLSWLPFGKGYVFIIVDPDFVLKGYEEEFDVFIRVLTRVAASWSTAVSDGECWDRPPVPFHIVLQIEPDIVGTLESRWSQTEVAVIKETV